MLRKLFASLLLCLPLHMQGMQEQDLLNQIQAHLTIGDYAEANLLIKNVISIYPNSKQLREAQIKAYAALGNEKQMVAAWKTYLSLFPEDSNHHEMMETMAWGVIHKGASSSSPLIRITTELAAFLSNDVQGISIIYKNLSDPNILVRGTAVQLSGQMRDSKLQEAIFKLFESEKDWKIRLALIESMGSMKIQKARKILIKLLENPKATAEEKQLAALAIVSLTDSIHTQEIATLVASSRAALRILACEILIALQPSEMSSLITPLIHDESSDVRAKAWQALAVLSDPYAKELSVERIIQEKNPETKVSAAWYMLLQDQAKGEKIMRLILQEDDQDARILASGALRASGHYGLPLILQVFQETSDPYVKINLALALIQQQTEKEMASSALYQICMNGKELWVEKEHSLFPRIAPSDIKFTDSDAIDNYPEVMDQLTRLQILNVLAIVKNPLAQAAIESFLSTKNWGVTGLASALLLTEGDETTLALVRNLIMHPIEKVRLQAALILALWGSDEEAIETLIQAYPKASRENKEHILEGLAKVGARSTLPFFIERLRDPYESIRIIAAHGIIQTLYH